MSDEKPSPLNDVIKGIGLLLRAAKTTVERLPTKDLEEVVVTSAREVGRAIENVATTVEREVFGRKSDPHPPKSPASPPKPPSSATRTPDGEHLSDEAEQDERDDGGKPPDAA